YQAFYDFHLSHYMSSDPDGTEENHFRFIWKLINRGIYYLEDRPYSPISIQRLDKLEEFQCFLTGLDKWGVAVPFNEALGEKIKRVEFLEEELASVIRELAFFKIPNQFKINIHKVGKAPIIDLLIQLQQLKSPDNGSMILHTTAQTVWAKILSNNFLDNGDQIKYGTALNYFKIEDDYDKDNPIRKTKVKDKEKIYRIKPSKKHSI
ncbi:MAG: hypothetical protein WD431_02895, partial [Cyclobacteriaceae bacterium]